jgi:hypothetical protein
VCSLSKISTGCQFHQHFMYNFFVRTSFFYIHITRKSCRNATFVRKIRTFNVDEIDYRMSSLFAGITLKRIEFCCKMTIWHFKICSFYSLQPSIHDMPVFDVITKFIFNRLFVIPKYPSVLLYISQNSSISLPCYFSFKFRNLKFKNVFN